jgi:hypothetical protein
MTMKRQPKTMLFRLLNLVLLLGSLTLQPVTSPAVALPLPAGAESIDVVPVQVTIYEPALIPGFGTCLETYWMSYPSPLGGFIYVTSNVNTTSYSSGTWRPNLPQDGMYKVEAFIADHPAVEFCNPVKTFTQDSSGARYEVHHKYGTTVRQVSQHPLADEWLDLGVYEFNTGAESYVTLRDLTGDANLSTTVNFGAMRFSLISGSISYFPVVYQQRLIPVGDEIQVMQAQGFDLCHPPTVNQMSTWWRNSPYRIFGLYLGGAMFSKDCEKVDAAWVQQVKSLGWTFIPTWVGPQAPCTTYYVRFDYNTSIAYTQGRQEADLAIAGARNMGLLPITTSKTILYYDMENYQNETTTEACKTAVKSFLNGWSKRLHELGFKSGSYGSACGSIVRDWALIDNPLDDVWIANWYTAPSSYDPNASVFGLSCVSDSLWPNHQRIRQYTEPHDENWGGVRLHIDSDVADGEVAVPNVYLLPSGRSSILVDLASGILDFQFVNANQGWLLSDRSLFETKDGGTSWQKLMDQRVLAASLVNDSLGYVLVAPAGKGELLGLYRTENPTTSIQETTWDMIPFLLPEGSWQIIQMAFASDEVGWIVLRQNTGSGIQQGLLLLTRDGGQSWREMPLAPPEAVYFSGDDQAWMDAGAQGEKLYSLSLTSTKSLNLQPSQPDQLKHSLEQLADTTSLSAATRSWLIYHSLNQATQAGLPGAPLRTWFTDSSTAWALIQDGSCSGEKDSPDFNCSTQSSLWQTTDAGGSWQVVHLP